MSKFGCGIFVKTFFTIKNLTKKVESIFQNGEKHYSNIFKKIFFRDIIGGKAAGSRYCPIWNR